MSGQLVKLKRVNDMNNKHAWMMNAIGIFWCVAGNYECGATCFCTALILFSIEGK